MKIFKGVFFMILIGILFVPNSNAELVNHHLTDSVPCNVSVILESQSMDSKILNKKVKYSVYLPKDYYTSSKKFPVLYILHGYGSNESVWIRYGDIQNIADRLMNRGDVMQMVIIMPDAGGSWYVNNEDGSVMYEDFFIKEMIPYMEKNLKIRPGKGHRAVTGESMGGFGALLLGLRHPDAFNAVGAMSSAVFKDEELMAIDQEKWNTVAGSPFGYGLKGEERLKGNYAKYTSRELIRSYKNRTAQTKLYIDCGDKDFLILGNMDLHAQLLAADIPHEFRIRGGAHTWQYWRGVFEEYILPWISQSFLNN